MTPTQQRILEVVSLVRDEKRKNRRIPTFCLGVELSLRLGPENASTARETLEEMESAGIVRLGPTISDYYIEIVDPEDVPGSDNTETVQPNKKKTQNND